MAQEVPSITNVGEEGVIRIAHKEYLGQVTSRTAFTMLNAFVLNPGHSNFPWLSQIAQSFSQYKWEGLIFHFRSTSGALATTQALGEVIGSVNYNVYERAPQNKTEMLNEVMSRSGAPCSEIFWPVECAPAQTTGQGLLNVRGAGTVIQGDLRLYDLGNFYLAVNGNPADNITLGELWVTYNVSLYKPQLLSQGINSAPDAMYDCAGCTQTALLGTERKVKFDGIGVTFPNNNTIQFPAGFQGTVWMQVQWAWQANIVQDFINQAYSTLGPAANSWNNPGITPSAGIQLVATQLSANNVGTLAPQTWAPSASTSAVATIAGTPVAATVGAKVDYTFRIPVAGTAQTISFAIPTLPAIGASVAQITIITGVQLTA